MNTDKKRVHRTGESSGSAARGSIAETKPRPSSDTRATKLPNPSKARSARPSQGAPSSAQSGRAIARWFASRVLFGFHETDQVGRNGDTRQPDALFHFVAPESGAYQIGSSERFEPYRVANEQRSNTNTAPRPSSSSRGMSAQYAATATERLKQTPGSPEVAKSSMPERAIDAGYRVPWKRTGLRPGQLPAKSNQGQAPTYGEVHR